MKQIVVAALLVLCSAVSAHAAWYEGGNLHDSTVIGWAISTKENILASCADYIKCSTEPGQFGKVQDKELRAAAEEVSACMQKFASAAVKPVTRENATPHIMACMTKAKATHPWMLTKPLELIAQNEPDEESSPVWDISKAKPLPYAIVDFDMERRATIKRNKASVRLILATLDVAGNVQEVPDSSQFTKEQLAATVIAAAKYAAQQSKAHFVGVALLSQLDAGYATTHLAVADYAPDGKGVSGRDNWKWQMVQAAESGLTKQEMAMQSLWGKLREQYQTPMGTNEDALSAVIGKELGIPADQVNTVYKPLLEVPKEFMDVVQATPGLEPKKGKR